jgi:hypothetical protein
MFGLSDGIFTAKSTRHNTITMLFAFVLSLIVFGATILAPFDFARANDCLPAPNSAAPTGSHWYFSLDRSTQKKCWYVRSSETHPQHARTPTSSTSASVPSTRAERVGSTVPDGIDGTSGQLESSANVIHDPVFNAVPNRSASEAAPQNLPSPALGKNASTDANDQANATTAVGLQGLPRMPPSVTTRTITTASVAAPMNPVSDLTDSEAPNGERIPIIIFLALAFALVVIGFGVREIMRHPESPASH